MTTAPRPSREIDGKGRTVRELLAGRKYSIDYYQREYKWQQKQLAELIDDIAAKFLESHEEGNERSAVADYGHYFLGSVIVSDKDGHPSEFQEYRNRIGGLLLLPKSFNASCGDLPYAEKRGHYAGQNLLARSLHESAYDHNPGFKRFVAESGLPFRAHAEFKEADLDARQALYQQLAERIWSPERLAQEVAS